VLNVWHTGLNIPNGTVWLPSENPPEMPPVKLLKANYSGALVSLIEKDNNHYLVIVNRSYINPMQLTLTVDEDVVRRVRKDGTITNTCSGTVEVDPGDVAIYTWKK
jgi:hypothetical protein